MLPDDWRIEHFAVIDSTNSYVAAAARSGALEGLVAVADFQLAGKGRLDRVWEAPAGSSLLASVLLRPAVEDAQLQLVVSAAALAVRDALQQVTGVVVDLKWPNDVLWNGKKLAGVLSEVVPTPAGPAIVVGVGLNCLAHDSSLAGATDVLEATGVHLEPRAFLDVVLVHLSFRRHQLDTPHGRDALRAEYVQALATIGLYVVLQTPQGEVRGRAHDVDETGALVLDINGRLTTYRVGDIIHLRPEEIT